MSVACSDCGAVQRIPALPPRAVALCLRCGRLLERSEALSLAAGLAWSAAVLLLLFPANVLPVMSASVRGMTHQTTILRGIRAVMADGWPLLGLFLGALVVVFPFVWAGLTTLVLAAVHTAWRPPWLGRAFRWAESIHLWAIPEVLTVAGFVIYMRTAEQLTAHVEAGGWCVIAAGALSVLMPRILRPHTVWRAIRADGDPPDGDSVACDACDLLLPVEREGTPCPRCGHRLRLRKPDALSRTLALLAGAYLLFVPAYYFPMSYTVQPGGLKERTILDGIRELFQAGFWYLGVIVIVASILIPLGKLVGLTWLVVRVKRPNRRHLPLKTRVYRVIHGIGRWSYTDPLIVSLNIPLLSFAGVVQVHTDVAALPFALVVALTMLAARTFDPRLLWDAAEGRL